MRRYGWNAGLAISVLTNFDKLIIYDCRFRPRAGDNARVARIQVFDCTEYVDKFDEIHDQLSRDSVYSGLFDSRFGVDEEREGTQPFDVYFLEQIEHWRVLLSAAIAERNTALSQDELNFVVQMLLNRIIFLRVCEDRELEKYRSLQEVQTYEDLKVLFRRADERYNSGLFDFIEDTISLNIDLQSNVLLRIFKELYYPESPYVFSVVETSVLGEIYEQFLANEIRTDPEVRVEQKPEVIASGGVVSTPQYVVDDIVHRTLAPALDGKTPDDLTHFYAADIACGAGTFLLSTYEYLLNFHLEWYLQDGAQKHSEKLYQVSQHQWRLTLQEKQRILLQHIFGVDIDQQAVEVARLSLLLRVIENETSATVDGLLRTYHIRALPNLTTNIRWGNSLLDDTFFDYDPRAITSHDLITRLNPMNWESAFPTVMAHGGFDVIVGNPPYVRIQNMTRYSPEEVAYYQSDASPYTSAKSDNFDKYNLFIERALSLLKASGYIGYIVPHKFLVARYGKTLRRLISSEQCLEEIIHFGVEQVFGKKVATYTCILILNKKQPGQFSVEHVVDLVAWRYGINGVSRTYEANCISEEPWIFVSPQADALFDRLRQENPMELGGIAEIMVGIQTSADNIYIIRDWDETETTVRFADFEGTQWEIEKAILRPCIYKATLPAYSSVRPNAYVIFPYQVVGRRAVAIPEDELRSRFPGCWEYFYAHKPALLSRSVQGMTEDTWYRFGRSQSLTKFEGNDKLIWSTLTLVPRYAYDDQNTIYSGGGNGPYYGLRMRPDAPVSIFYVQAVLSHRVFEAIVAARASEFRGGYRSHGKQFMEELPIRVDFPSEAAIAAYREIVRLVPELIGVTEQSRSAGSPQQRDALLRRQEMLRQRIEHLVETVYNLDSSELKRIPELLDVAETS